MLLLYYTAEEEHGCFQKERCTVLLCLLINLLHAAVFLHMLWNADVNTCIDYWQHVMHMDGRELWKLIYRWPHSVCSSCPRKEHEQDKIPELSK